MAKHIALFAFVEVDGVEFNTGKVRSYTITSEDALIDAGGFNSTGDNEQLAGIRTKSVEIEFYTDRALDQLVDVVYPIHRDRLTVEIAVRENQNEPVSATNPEWRGDVILPTWNEGATFGDVEVTTLTFISQGDDGIEMYNT